MQALSMLVDTWGTELLEYVLGFAKPSTRGGNEEKFLVAGALKLLADMCQDNQKTIKKHVYKCAQRLKDESYEVRTATVALIAETRGP